MSKKYKGVLKLFKTYFNEVYNKTHDPNLTNKENTQNAINMMANQLGDYIGTDNERYAARTAVGYKALIDDMNGELIHYFISDNNLVKFLKSTEVKDYSIIDEYIRENKTPLDFISSLKGVSYYSIALHTEEEGYVFTYLFNKEITFVFAFCNNSVTDFALGKTKINDNEKCKLAINLIYYLKAFPEKILDGVPSDMVRDDKKKFSESHTYNISIADEIVEKTEIKDGRVIIPHFRSGFFRHYSDDRYINMKGKVQFIAATMVKGKAKTVVA